MKKTLLILSICICSIASFSQTLFDSFSMDFDAFFSHSTPPTTSGQAYSIKVTGTWGVWPENLLCLDAAFQFEDESSGAPITPEPWIKWSWNGIYPTTSTAFFRPTPDVYDSNHVYWFYFTGNDSSQIFEFYDAGPYSDNSGSLNFEIYANVKTGINEIDHFEGFTLFPNPTADRIYISLNSSEVFEFSIYDIVSKKIFEEEFTSSLSMDTKHLAKGVYFYAVRNKFGASKKGKFVKD